MTAKTVAVVAVLWTAGAALAWALVAGGTRAKWPER